MNNKTLILIGLCICLLFTLPMVSAAEISADSGLIDNSVIESNFDNVDSDIASSIEDDTNILSAPWFIKRIRTTFNTNIPMPVITLATV